MANFKDIMAMCLDGGSYAAISAALGCSNRDIAKTKTLIADLSITKESFAQLDPAFFDEYFSDHRGARRKLYDQPDFEKLARRLANNKHLTRHKLWMDYIAAPAGEGESKYQYSQLNEHGLWVLSIQHSYHTAAITTVCGKHVRGNRMIVG